LVCCELDSEIEALAQKYFGFKRTPRTNVVVGDGVHLLEKLRTHSETGTSEVPDGVDVSSITLDDSAQISAGVASANHLSGASAGNAAEVSTEGLPSTYDLIYFDVDSKDPSLALSAPPAEFITERCLANACALLNAKGMLVINASARGAEGERIITQMQQSLRALMTSCIYESLSKSGTCPKGSDEVYMRADISRMVQLFELKASEETNNVALVAVKPDCSHMMHGNSDKVNGNGGGKGSKKGGKAKPQVLASASGLAGAGVTTAAQAQAQAQAQRRNVIEDWLASVGQTSDPLNLYDLVDKMKSV
jgi:hypothetical protein